MFGSCVFPGSILADLPEVLSQMGMNLDMEWLNEFFESIKADGDTLFSFADFVDITALALT